jgi:hypothetical protein
MSIQIIDGFQVNTAAPIDNRIVASGSVARNAIPYKYEGLRVFDTSDSVAYVYVNGAWRSENSSGIVGSGTTNYLTAYTSSSTIGNSLLRQVSSSIKTDGDRVTINTADGSVTAVSFIGAGSGITSIPGANINNGSVPINKLTNGSNGQVLVSGVSSTTWIDSNQMTVGTASSVGVTQSSTNATHYLTFVDSPTSGSKKLLLDSSGITYNPGTNQLGLATGSSATPSLSFTGDTDTGIFSPGSNVTAIASSGSEKVRFAVEGFSTGLGTPIVGMYAGRVNFIKTGANAGNVTRIVGGDYAGNRFTISNVNAYGSGIKARINFPTPIPIGTGGSSANLCVVCSIDIQQEIDVFFFSPYPYSVICTGRTTNYIDLLCFRTDNVAWNSGTVIGSFVAYSLGYGVD